MFSRIQSHIARKQHKCSLCGKVIEKGEQYTRAVVGGDGVDFCEDKYHSKCYELVERYCRKLDADDYLDLWHLIDDVMENVCDSCEKNTMCDLKRATIARCDRVQKQYEVKKIWLKGGTMKSDSIEYDIYVVPEGCDEWQYHSSYATRPLATRTASELTLLWPEWRVMIYQRRMHAIYASGVRDFWKEK